MPIIDLNCVTFCDEVAFLDETDLPITADGDGQPWQFEYNWNGRKRKIELTFDAGEEIILPANMLNETNLYINLYKQGIFVNKYKVKVYPLF